MRKPDFILFGAPKCGTTSMLSYLNSHPQIFMPPHEVHFFGNDLSERLTGERPKWWIPRPTTDEYFEMFSDASDEKIIGEKSPMYFYSQTAAADARALLGEIKIILMLRCPPDLIYSMHRMLLNMGVETEPNFAKALKLEATRRSGWRLDEGGNYVKSDFYDDIGRLSEHASRIFKEFPREKIHVTLYDDLKADPTAVYKGIVRFLGASEDFQPDFKIENKAYQIRSHAVSSFAASPPSLLRSVARLLMPRSVRRKVRAILADANRIEARPEPMSAELRQHLLEKYAPDIKLLSGVIDRDLCHWLT